MNTKTANINKAAFELLDYYKNTRTENLVNHLLPFLSDADGKGKSVYFFIYTTGKRNQLISSGVYSNPVLSADLYFKVDNTDCKEHHIITLTKRGNGKNNYFCFSFDLSGIKVLKENTIKNIYTIRFESENLLYHLEFVD